MPYAAELQQIFEQHAQEIDDLRTIARLHGLPSGAPEHLVALPLRISQDARLRSDITELVRSLQAQDPDLGLPDVLSLVLAAVGGSAKFDRRRDLDEAVDLTGGFLASLGGWPGSEVEPTIDIDNPPDHDPRLDLPTSAYTEPLEADLAPQTVHQEEVTVTGSAIENNDQTARDLSEAVGLAEITHALARLERGNLELRLHLDSIDQRICRMEPLLEAAPHSEPPPSSPDPTRTNHLPSSSPTDERDPLHRGLSLADTAALRDQLEEVKAMRRISLTSNFLDPASPSARSLATPTSLPQSAAAPVAANSSEPAADPLPSPRVQQPRRDRFAAAREIPGNSAETDPLYIGLEQEQPSVEMPAAPLAPNPLEAMSPPSVPAASEPEPLASRPAMVAEEIEQDVRSSEPPPTSGSREWLFNDPPARRKFNAAPGPWTATPPSIAMIDEDAPRRSRTGRWIAGAAAAAVIGAAGFLYVNGLPSFLSEWVSGASTAMSTNSDRKAPAAAEGSQTARVNGLPDLPADPVRSMLPERSASSSKATTRLPGAREALSPGTSGEKIEGPTFVPGGIMDGYLISAPRPKYPEMANLVGAQGKITFEAMVSKQGQVEAVKVLGGPQVLRSAAADAVKQWQYRPFAIKGRPVEVRTIIRVDVAAHPGAAATE